MSLATGCPFDGNDRAGIMLAHAVDTPRFDSIVDRFMATAKSDWARGKIASLVTDLRALD